MPVENPLEIPAGMTIGSTANVAFGNDTDNDAAKGKLTFAAFLGLALFGSVFVLPVFLQSLHGFTAWQTGKVILPGALPGYVGGLQRLFFLDRFRAIAHLSQDPGRAALDVFIVGFRVGLAHPGRLDAVDQA